MNVDHPHPTVNRQAEGIVAWQAEVEPQRLRSEPTRGKPINSLTDRGPVFGSGFGFDPVIQPVNEKPELGFFAGLFCGGLGPSVRGCSFFFHGVRKSVVLPMKLEVPCFIFVHVDGPAGFL